MSSLTPNWRGSWNALSSYIPGDLVQYQGTTWIAVVNTTNGVPGTDLSWAIFAIAGSKGDAGAAGGTGATGLGFRWTGNWSAVVAYQPRDAVSYNNCAFVCLNTTTPGITPLTGDDIHSAVDSRWSMMAQAIPFIFRSAWDNLTHYFFNDVVTFNNVMYVALVDNTSHQPDTSPSKWAVMITSGQQGDFATHAELSAEASARAAADTTTLAAAEAYTDTNQSQILLTDAVPKVINFSRNTTLLCTQNCNIQVDPASTFPNGWVKLTLIGLSSCTVSFLQADSFNGGDKSVALPAGRNTELWVTAGEGYTVYEQDAMYLPVNGILRFPQNTYFDKSIVFLPAGQEDHQDPTSHNVMYIERTVTEAHPTYGVTGIECYFNYQPPQQGDPDISSSGAVFNSGILGTFGVDQAMGMNTSVSHLSTGHSLEADATLANALIYHGTIDQVRAVEARVSMIGDATVNEAAALHAGLYGVGVTGTVHHAYGLKVEDITGGATKSYAIKTGKGLVQFGADSGFGVDLQAYVDENIVGVNALNPTPMPGGFTVAFGASLQDNSLETMYASYYVAESTHAAGNKDTIQCTGMDVYHSGAGTVSNLTADQKGTFVLPGAGNVEEACGQTMHFEHDSANTTNKARGIAIRSAVRTDGTVNEFIGLLVEDQTAATNNRAIKTGLGKVEFGDDVILKTVNLLSGAGIPTVDVANGSIFLRTDGGAGSTFYVREGGAWVAK